MTFTKELELEVKLTKKKRKLEQVNQKTTWLAPQATKSMINNHKSITKLFSSLNQTQEAKLICQIYHNEVAGIQRRDQSIIAMPKLQSVRNKTTTLLEPKVIKAHNRANMEIHMIKIE